MHETPFKFEIACNVFEKADAPAGQRRRIAGIVSTDHLDQQGERLIQEGLDFGPFMSKGYFNDNHLREAGKGVGVPQRAELVTLKDGKKGWYVEGVLLEGHGPSDEIWSMAKALERSGTNRRLGYSVEGAIVERDPENPSTVRKAIVREVAVTRCPVNDHTGLAVLAKSLSAGHAVSAPAATPGEGFPLRTESLEGAANPRPTAKKKRRLKKSDAVELLLKLGATPNQAHIVADYAARHYPAAA